MSKGQIAYLAVLLAGYVSLMLGLAWGTLHNQLDGQRFRKKMVTARRADAARRPSNEPPGVR